MAMPVSALRRALSEMSNSAGGGAKLAHMAVRGMGGGVSSLREALVEAAAGRGAGRIASREVDISAHRKPLELKI